MSKKDGWDKKNAFEWEKRGDNFRAEIGKYSGGLDPYKWAVYPLPRPQNERWMPIGRGYAPKLAEAKAQADDVISQRTEGRT